eukprot:scaffold4170_cov63-Phaeocystis_antarctica.AAC.3
MTRRGSSGLQSWPRMMPCSSPLSFDSAIAARAGARMAGANDEMRKSGRAHMRPVVVNTLCSPRGWPPTTLQ